MLALIWLFPMLWALYNSFRDYAYTADQRLPLLRRVDLRQLHGGLGAGQLRAHFINSLLITVPAVLLTLFLSSMVAFVLARFSYRFNLTLLGVFLAANLLPPQALLIPVFRMFREIPLPDVHERLRTMLNSFWALILVNTAFQLGFCTFVLSNYMKTLPHEIYESAQVDGASVWRQYWQLTMPLVRPALAALATLQVTWIYNEFFWATVLMPGGDKFPVTSALNNLRGQFFTDTNLVAAGSVHRGPAGADRLLRPAEAVRLRADPGIDQGMSAPGDLRVTLQQVDQGVVRMDDRRRQPRCAQCAARHLDAGVVAPPCRRALPTTRAGPAPTGAHPTIHRPYDVPAVGSRPRKRSLGPGGCGRLSSTIANIPRDWSGATTPCTMIRSSTVHPDQVAAEQQARCSL